MYLSRVELDTSNRQKMSHLRQAADYHRWVESCFDPNKEYQNGARLRHLWRLDQLNNHLYLMILSKNKPEIKSLSKYGVSNTAQIKSYDKFLNNLVTNKTYRFKITANPTYSSQNINHSHVTVEYQLKWLIDRMKNFGFKINTNPESNLAITITNREQITLHHKDAKEIKFASVTYEGILTITDLKTFKETMINGIGREKAYGMGLLTIIPIP